jgi:hypothetical protein
LQRQAADSLLIEKDAVAGRFFPAGLAEIETRTGEPEDAVNILRQLITAPAGQVVSIARLTTAIALLLSSRQYTMFAICSTGVCPVSASILSPAIPVLIAASRKLASRPYGETIGKV